MAFTKADVLALRDLRCEVTQLTQDTVLIPRCRGPGLVAGNLAVVSKAVLREAPPDSVLSDLMHTSVDSGPRDGPWASGAEAEAWVMADPPVFRIREVVQVYTTCAIQQYDNGFSQVRPLRPPVVLRGGRAQRAMFTPVCTPLLRSASTPPSA